MNRSPLVPFLIFFSFIILSQAFSQESHYELTALNCDDEAKYLWSILQQYDFYIKNGYTISLPDAQSFQSYLEKAKTHTLNTREFNSFYTVFSKEIFSVDKYKNGYKAVLERVDAANQAVPTFQRYNTLWGFKNPDKIKIKLTLYGPGGSYDPRSATITMMTTPAGTFKRGIDPLDTILHETVHIGIEECIAQKYGLTHWEKERLVDQFVKFHFPNQLPLYKMQNIPDTRIDMILSDKDIWEYLPERVQAYKGKGN
jgi:hypothetical protein